MAARTGASKGAKASGTKATRAKAASAPVRPAPTARAVDRAERVVIRDRAQWRAWLAANHTRPDSIWLVYDKAAAGAPRALTYDDIVEELLCFGWIDSLTRSLSATQAMIYISPRKPRGTWSALNKRRIELLEARGLMTPAGRAVIEAAKADGSWDALVAAESLEVPPDLAKALRAARGARSNFDAFPPGARKIMLWWICSAKRDQTRAGRVAQVASAAAKNRRAGPAATTGIDRKIGS